VFFLQNIPQN